MDVNIRDNATEGAVFWPKTRLLVIAGGLFGLVAGALVLLGLEALSADLIRSSRDLERHAGLVVVGTIPATQSRRAGAGAVPPR